MGTYPKAKLVKLDQALRLQHERKLSLKRRHADTESVLRSAEWIAEWCALPLPYVRRYTWEAKLDPFPGPKRNNDIWVAAFAVVYLGYPSRLASEEFGFTIPSIEQYMRKAGWKRFVVWGNVPKKKLALPKPFVDENWEVSRSTPTVDTAGSTRRFAYFSKRHY